MSDDFSHHGQFFLFRHIRTVNVIRNESGKDKELIEAAVIKGIGDRAGDLGPQVVPPFSFFPEPAGE